MDKKFLTVGELAQLMGTTVRTLQYYDREGLLKPSALSEGGRRLYSAKDMVKLHQILSFKYLGFSLEEIKSNLFTLDNPQQVALALEQQQKTLEAQIEGLQEACQALRALHTEVVAIQEVDFSKYAEIIELLKIGNENYWVWKHFDKPLQNHIRSRFGNDAEAGTRVFDTYRQVLEEALALKRRGESPTSETSRKMAKAWWDMVLEFTGGDMSLLPQLEAFNDCKSEWGNSLAEKQLEVDAFVAAALQSYFSALEGGAVK